MTDPATLSATLHILNSLAGGLFLLAAFGMVATRQVKDCLQLFIIQSVLLAASALLLGIAQDSWHLYGVAIVNLISKPFIIPWILRRTSPKEVYTLREIDQVLNIPISLLIALGLAILAFFSSIPMLRDFDSAYATHNLPIGFAALLLGAYTLSVRREAVPLLLGLLAMENGAFFAGISIAGGQPLLVELAVATDGLVTVFILGVMTRALREHIGTTEVGALSSLREGQAEEVRL